MVSEVVLSGKITFRLGNTLSADLFLLREKITRSSILRGRNKTKAIRFPSEMTTSAFCCLMQAEETNYRPVFRESTSARVNPKCADKVFK